MENIEILAQLIILKEFIIPAIVIVVLVLAMFVMFVRDSIDDWLDN